MRLCGLRMRLCKGYTDKEKRKMKKCDSHVNEEVKFVTLPPSYCPRILDLVYDVAEQIKRYNGIGDSGKS